MGHTVKRVPQGFSYPLKKVWEGYINPYPSEECPDCEGTGFNPETKQIADSFKDKENPDRQWCDKITQDEVQALVDENRLWNFTRVPLNAQQKEDAQKSGNGLLPYNNGRIPSADEVNEWNRKMDLNGHDLINLFILVEIRAKRLGVFGHCPTCKGEGVVFKNEELRKFHKEWKEYEPPVGDGYQLWDTTGDGSPISPVFATIKELAYWCAEDSIQRWREKWLEDLTGENKGS